MDQLDHYRDIVLRLVEEYAGYKPAYGDIRTEAVVDRERDRDQRQPRNGAAGVVTKRVVRKRSSAQSPQRAEPETWLKAPET